MANLTYPPSNRDELQFNFLDSFATSWVTPEFSKEPCFLSLYYWNSSATEPWTNKFNHSTRLNGTEIVSLKMIGSDGLGQLNLNYVDPVGGHKKATGAIFRINHDYQPEARTWNQNALLPSTTSPPGSSEPTILASTPATLSASTTSVPTAANTVALTPTVTVSASAGKSASSSNGAKVASIVLGTVLGVVFAAALIMFWIRRRRRRRTPEQAIRLPSVTPLPVYTTTSALQEKDAGGALSELRGGDGRWELDAGKR